jgi:hypothetical protein
MRAVEALIPTAPDAELRELATVQHLAAVFARKARRRRRAYRVRDLAIEELRRRGVWPPRPNAGIPL